MHSWINHTLNLVFPEPCIHCGAMQNSSLLLCDMCLCELPQTLHPIGRSALISNIWGLGNYDGPLGSIVRRCKYKPDHAILRALCARIKSSAFPWALHSFITHVPTTKRRLFTRGFDQARALANTLAHQSTLTHHTYLKRLDPFSQGMRSPKERTAQLSYRFACIKPPPSRLLIIDDVRTSGGTLDACAMTLLNNGCQDIHAIVLGY